MNDRETIALLADSWVERHRPESMNTDWGQALLAYGMARAWRTTGSESAREYLRRWLTYHLGAGTHLSYFVGSWGIGLLYPELPEEFPIYRHELHDLAGRLEELIRRKAIRNGEGILLHNVDLPHIYIDTIYYAAPVLAKVSQTIGREGWEPEAMRQLRGHLEVLRDADSPFFIHCEQNMSGLRSQGAWGRGNGWVAMSCGELLDLLDRESEEYRSVATILTTLIGHLLPLQTAGGLWRTILNDPEAYEESSASAMFLVGMLAAERHGLLSGEASSAIDRGLEGLRGMIDESGRLTGSSEGTWPGDRDYYRGLDRGEWWWGTGAALLAFCEAMGRNS